MLTHPQAPPDLLPTPTGPRTQAWNHVRSVLDRQLVTPAELPPPAHSLGKPQLSQAADNASHSALSLLPSLWAREGGSAGIQSGTVPGLSLVQGLQTGLAVPVGMEG